MTGYNDSRRYAFRWDMNTPVAPGTSRTTSVSLTSAGVGVSYAAMAKEVARSWTGVSPQRVATWQDRRPITAIFIASSVPHPPTNPRGWFNNERTVDTTTPEGIIAFRKSMLSYFDGVIEIAKEIDAQGVMVCDIKGQEQAHAASYVCDPEKISVVAPEMLAQGPGDTLPLVDEIFARIRAAGLKVGVCLRPSRWNTAGAVTGIYQVNQPDPAAVIDDKVDYAVRRWGASMFYLDSNVDPVSGVTVPSQQYLGRVRAHYPEVLLSVEHSDQAHYGTGAPYFDAEHGGMTGTAAQSRYPYPGAFSIIRVNRSGTGTPASAYADRYMEAARRGDILMTLGWFRSDELALVKSSYTAVGARPSVSVATPAVGLTARYRTPVTLTAAAADADGRVTKVDYLDGPVRLGQATVPPYAVKTVRPFRSVARDRRPSDDDGGNTGYSAPVVVTITP